MQKKSSIPAIVCFVLAVACLLIGVGVLRFGGEGARAFLDRQSAAFVVDTVLLVGAGVVLITRRRVAAQD